MSPASAIVPQPAPQESGVPSGAGEGVWPAPALLGLGDADRELRGIHDRLDNIAGEIGQAYVVPGNASAHQLDLELKEVQRGLLRAHAKLHAVRRTLAAAAPAADAEVAS